MSNPFAAALPTLFDGPGSAAATYTPLGGTAVPIRVIRTVQEGDIPFGDTSIPIAAAVFEIQRADIATPGAGDLIVIGSGSFVVEGEPRLDVEGVTWHVDAPPI